MSGLEQRTKGRDEALAGVPAVTAVIARSPNAENAVGPPILPVSDWSAIEGDLLDERRAAVPAFPLELLTPPWREWVTAAARSADAPVDYVAQALLATVAGVSSARVWVGITEDWVEPLQLWLAAVGAPSTGKSPALALVHRLVDKLKLPRMQEHDRRRPRIILYGGTTESVEDELADSRLGQLLWRDGAEGCFTPLKRMASARHLEALPVSILGSIEPDGVAQALQRGGEGLAARFLYAWPHPASFCPLAERAHAQSDAVVAQLQRLVEVGVAASRQPRFLFLDQPGMTAFNAFLARLHADVRQAEGLEAAWLGKGRGTVACLAATFALMSWSSAEQAESPRFIGAESVERAVSLWSGYYRPHASAFFQSAVPTDVECQARRVVRWLRADGRSIVSRRDVRRTALAQTVNASEADRVLARLVEAGVLRPMANEGPAQRGRPALRWQVNPLLATA